MPDDLAIDVRGMTKRFGNRVAVDHVDLQVRTGEICGFLGPNGSGKTTFIRMLCGLLRADAGSGTCLGYDVITQSKAIKRQVGYMTQRFSFYEDLSIRENLDLWRACIPWRTAGKRYVTPLSGSVSLNGAANWLANCPGDGNSASLSPPA